jgi:hypothetical protein
MKNFLDFDDPPTFKAIVMEHHTSFVSEVGMLKANVIVDESRVDAAFSQYDAHVKHFGVLLNGGGPDHYKRAASLLTALNSAKVIVSYEATPESDDAEVGWMLGYSHDDLKDDVDAIRFYETYHNEAAAFDLAFRCCDFYEEHPHLYDENYAATICNYLKYNTNLNVESLYMILRSLMHISK